MRVLSEAVLVIVIETTIYRIFDYNYEHEHERTLIRLLPKRALSRTMPTKETLLLTGPLCRNYFALSIYYLVL